ncbi:MAG: hypothetical protein KDB01_00580 [Planctomycetaceae bacterium]|nr:hypothetical protein [Planctomycetaceae bacterium]
MKNTLLLSGVILTFVGVCTALSRAHETGPAERHAEDEMPEPAVSVECHGRLRHGVAAIGCETTGTTISFHRVTWELQLRDAASREFAARHHKEPVIVTGTLQKVEATESKVRWIVDVVSLREFPARDRFEEAATVTIRGMLRAALSQTSDSPELSVHADDQIWKLEFAADAAAQTAAESLIGEIVLISGSVLPLPEEVPRHNSKLHALKTQSVRVKTIKGSSNSAADDRFFK